MGNLHPGQPINLSTSQTDRGPESLVRSRHIRCADFDLFGCQTTGIWHPLCPVGHF
jgi:hypothetical protein